MILLLVQSTLISATEAFFEYFYQAGLRSIWEKYYEEAHAVVYVIDATCPSRFEESKSALGEWCSVVNFKNQLPK